MSDLLPKTYGMIEAFLFVAIFLCSIYINYAVRFIGSFG